MEKVVVQFIQTYYVNALWILAINCLQILSKMTVASYFWSSATLRLILIHKSALEALSLVPSNELQLLMKCSFWWHVFTPRALWLQEHLTSEAVFFRCFLASFLLIFLPSFVHSEPHVIYKIFAYDLVHLNKY